MTGARAFQRERGLARHTMLRLDKVSPKVCNKSSMKISFTPRTKEPHKGLHTHYYQHIHTLALARETFSWLLLLIRKQRASRRMQRSLLLWSGRRRRRRKRTLITAPGFPTWLSKTMVAGPWSLQRLQNLYLLLIFKCVNLPH